MAKLKSCNLSFSGPSYSINGRTYSPSAAYFNGKFGNPGTLILPKSNFLAPGPSKAASGSKIS